MVAQRKVRQRKSEAKISLAPPRSFSSDSNARSG
jgi:hypothetical protein